MFAFARFHLRALLAQVVAFARFHLHALLAQLGRISSRNLQILLSALKRNVRYLLSFSAGLSFRHLCNVFAQRIPVPMLAGIPFEEVSSKGGQLGSRGGFL